MPNPLHPQFVALSPAHGIWIGRIRDAQRVSRLVLAYPPSLQLRFPRKLERLRSALAALADEDPQPERRP